MDPDRQAIAKEKGERFLRRFDPSYRQLAYYAALPLVLTPELLNYLRNAFLRGQTSWIAEADLLLSDLCSPVGYEQYAMEPDVRAWLILEMRKDLGEKPMEQASRLLLRYVQLLAREGNRFGQDELQAQQWSAMAFLPDQRHDAARQIAEALRQRLTGDGDRFNLSRARHNQAELARLQRIAASLAPQTSECDVLLQYAEKVGRLLAGTTDGETATAAETASPIKVQDVELPALQPEPPAETVSQEQPQPVRPRTAAYVLGPRFCETDPACRSQIQ